MNRTVLVALFIIGSSCTPKNNSSSVVTFAGSGTIGKLNGKRLEASFANPMGLTIDKSGNMYVADSQNNLIRKIDSIGNTFTYAGTGEVGNKDGTATEASFFYPTALALDDEGNMIVADTQNNLVRKISAAGRVTTLAKNSKIHFDKPSGLAIDKLGNIFVTDFSNRIRMINKEDSVVEIAGTGERGDRNGKCQHASFYVPRGIAFDKDGNLLICDTFNNQIRMLNTEGNLITLSGSKKKGMKNGSLDSAFFFHPQNLAVGMDGAIYVADTGNHLIRKIESRTVSTIAGNGLRGSTDGPRLRASFWNPMGIALDAHGNLFIADYQNNVIRKITP